MSNWKDQFKQAARQAGLLPTVDRFYFLRHGETDHNRYNIVQGWVDTPLNALGEAQARQSALALKNLPITGIVHSPLHRAHRTAQLVSDATGYPMFSAHAGLKERHHGNYEGKPASGVVWALHDDKSESYDVFCRRTALALNESLTDGVPLIVAHGGTRRVLLYGLDVEIPDAAMGNAVPMEFSCVNGVWQVKVLFLPTVTEAASEM